MIEGSVPVPGSPPRVSIGSLRLQVPLIVALILFAGISLILFRWADDHSSGETARKAAEDARVQANLLTSELQKFQLLPIVLPEYPEVRQALLRPAAETNDLVNRKLELLADRTNAAVIYLIDRNGLTIAASNYRQRDSFVGQNYGFRPYFSGAMRTGAAQLFALGTVSGRPGLYIARRIDDSGTPSGVAVVKVEFDSIERAWSKLEGPVIVTDRSGIVLITSEPEWRFNTVTPLDQPTREAARESLQFGSAPLSPLPVRTDGQQTVIGQAEYRAGTAAVPLLDATLTSFRPRAPDKATDIGTARTATLIVLIALALALAVLARSREGRLREEQARVQLERQVRKRTAELTEANRLLKKESVERAKADERYRSAREKLAQANRLGSLGQITAGVAHEVNQPVAAIRTFAENAMKYLARGDRPKADENLATIVTMTERIGTITSELRRFARRRTPRLGDVSIADVLEGAQLLVGDQLRTANVTVTWPVNSPGLKVAADRVRLEQVLINLIQNAIQATSAVPCPEIVIGLESAESKVAISIKDNGPGVDQAIADAIFTPFVTGRPDGLGLGLSIAREIAREFDGDLSLVPSNEGACFLLELNRA